MFLAKRGELLARFDPKMVRYNRQIPHTGVTVVPLKSLLAVSPQYGAGEAGAERSSLDQPRYIRITDIDEFGFIDPDALGVTAEIVEDRYYLKQDDILIARSGNTVGKSYIHKVRTEADNSAFFAGYLIRFVPDPSKVLPDYLFLYTQLTNYKKWVDAIQRPTGQPNINAEEYQALPVILPVLEAQATYVALYRAAQKTYQQQRAQARAHLTDLDTYLAQVLGISLPPGGPVPLAERQFRVRSRQVVGQRLDPLYYLFDLNQLLRGCPYPAQPLGPLCTSFATGFAAGHQGQTEDDDPTGIIQIRPTNISADRQFIFNRNIHIGAAELADRPDQLLQPGEVLFNNTNSQELVGKSVVFDLAGPFCCSNHITRLTLHPDQLDPYYLAAVLNMYQRHRVFFSLCTNWNNQSGINADVLRALRLPVPPLAKQQEIAAHLQGIQQEARTLEQAAYNTLAQARLQIEQLILQPIS